MARPWSRDGHSRTAQGLRNDCGKGEKMGILIVGADNVRTIENEVARLAPALLDAPTEHWTGRKAGDSRKVIPSRTRLVVVVCERVNHELLRHVRRQAAKIDVPLIYCRHSALEMREKLEDFIGRQPAGVWQ